MSYPAHNQSPATSADFVVVVSNDDDILEGFHHFAEKVNRKLKAGYTLHGQPFCLNQKMMCQALVRQDGAAHSGETTMFFKHPAEAHTR